MIDIWALGAIAYEMFVNKKAFSGRNIDLLCTQIANCDFDKQILEENYLNPKIKDLIKSCLVYNPEDRPKIT